MRRMLQVLAFLTVAGLGLCPLGCGAGGERLPETGATLQGTVTYGKEKVPMALVIVMGPGGMATGTIGEDGRYKVENAPLGAVKIGINTDAVKGELMSKTMSQSYAGPESKGKAKAAAPKFVDVPAKFAEPETSGIKTTVKKGANPFDIVISK